MEVYALVGPSGTGKSHRAMVLAHKYNAQLIIDDGLVIKGDRILVGHSAKKQPTRIGAIKVALFMGEDHVNKARKTLQNISPERILILGTSTRMVERIATRLEAPKPSKIIFINDIATPKEIRKARYVRKHYGKHVIPAPSVEVKRTFPETIIDSLHVFLHRKGKEGPKSWLEQSVVRPTFTSLGRFFITNNALASIVAHTLTQIEDISTTGKITIGKTSEGVIIDVTPSVYYGCNLANVANHAQLEVKDIVESMTSLVVSAVNIHIKGLDFTKNRPS
ncbi:MAG TPA: Asp23/Gls24 family envelope stress response protein [Clostridia bacterium]|nr:Asp23/Gls24 family envelope stress response protein [Clostridia bacterium]